MHISAERQRYYGTIRRFKLRKRVIDSLGGMCANCGIDDPRVLQIDHILGGGKKELNSMYYENYLKKVIKEKDNNAYQLLCANCNWIKRSIFDEV